MDSSVYANKEFIAASKRWVNVYCSKDTGHGSEKGPDGKDYCKLIPGIACEDHVACDRDVSGKFFNGTIRTPASVWCDATGKQIGQQQGAMSAKQLIEKLAEAEKAVGPGLGADEYGFILGKLAAGEKAGADGKVKDAIDAYAAVTKMSKTPGAKPFCDKAQAALDKLAEGGKTRLGDAMAAKDAKDFAKAKVLLKALAADFKGQPLAKDVEKAMADVAAAEKDAGKK